MIESLKATKQTTDNPDIDIFKELTFRLKLMDWIVFSKYMEAPVMPVSIIIPIVITEVIGVVFYFTNLIHFGWKVMSGGFDSGYASERKKCHQISHVQAYNLLIL